MVTGRLKRALDEMIWSGARRADAATIAGMTDHSLRTALKKPHVKAYYLTELGVLRESTKAKIHHRLEALSDQDENKAAAVKACQVLIADEEESRHGRGIVTQPGLTIVIQQSVAAPRVEPIDVTLPAPIGIEAYTPASEPIFQHPLRRR